ncbi:MAG: FAD-dependent oxidoreductase [Candidatus Dadabacteria bacterium]|nr:FAD-dependent oxidoreductase [Candidatus Dadabacteria bacterium]NIQ16475.1 FAD-dependent oxidoreductase [Candidatus Dadabacteria bacterium]
MNNEQFEHKDIAIIGGGPAGMQAALIASRARKKVVVFDNPAPPRNGASLGVHNFLGFDGLLVPEVRKVAWKQINTYKYAELIKELVIDIQKSEDGKFILSGFNGTRIKASKVVLCTGYQDVYPDVPGFVECWGNTVVHCPYCDGYENRDRVWGIVPRSEDGLFNLAQLSLNWASESKIFLPPGIEADKELREDLNIYGMSIYEGNISEIHHNEGKTEAVTLESGEKIDVETLLWIPPYKTVPLIDKLVENLGLELNEDGFVKTYEDMKTNINGLWSAGEVNECCSNALNSAIEGSTAVKSIIYNWYDLDKY